jgi:hypothetical protein
MAVRVSALRSGRVLHSGSFLVLISVKGCVALRVIGQLKNPVTSLVIEPTTFRLVANTLNELPYRVPPNQFYNAKGSNC